MRRVLGISFIAVLFWTAGGAEAQQQDPSVDRLVSSWTLAGLERGIASGEATRVPGARGLLVIDRAGMSVSATSMEDGYRFEYKHDPKDPDRGFFSKLAFWRDDGPNYSGTYRAVIQADGKNTRVFIKNADGSDADQAAAEHLLSIFGERLG